MLLVQMFLATAYVSAALLAFAVLFWLVLEAYVRGGDVVRFATKAAMRRSGRTTSTLRPGATEIALAERPCGRDTGGTVGP